jgi:two-component system, OmpR family, response regulator TctD
MTLLLIEDEKAMRETLQRTLSRKGWDVRTASDGEQGFELWKRLAPSVVLLDLSLPKLDGLNVLAKARESGLDSPVIILTARGTVGDKIIGLNLGADDYIPKPFDLDELEARINALIRRKNRKVNDNFSDEKQDLQVGRLKLNIASGAIVVDGNTLTFTPRESKMLSILMQRCGNVVTKEQLFNQIFLDELDVNIEAVEVVAYRLRKKIQGLNCEIVTLRGLGYLLK